MNRLRSRLLSRVTAPLTVLLTVASPMVAAQSQPYVTGSLVDHDQLGGEALEDKLGISLRLGMELETEPDAALDLEDFGSRITWGDRLSDGDGPEVLAFFDLGFGLNRSVNTREAWLGISDDFGTITGGTQYRAFYDLTSAFTDVGWWDTCYTGIGCNRAPGVLKYENDLGPELRVIASATLVDSGLETTGTPDGFDDTQGNDNEFIEQLEGGVTTNLGGLQVGAAFGIDLRDDTGFALGAAASTEVGDGVTVGAMVQLASEDYARLDNDPNNRFRNLVRDDESLFLASVSAATEQVYGLLSIGNYDDTVFGLTGGYVVSNTDRSKIYAEIAGIDEGTENSDFDFRARVVYLYHYGAAEAARRR